MRIVDDNGRLFGKINLIDALVVLLVLAVAIAGVALINPFVDTESTTRYATVDLGDNPEFLAEQISSGDQLVEDAEGNLTVTDVYYTPNGDGEVRVILRAALRGTVSEESERFQYAGESLQPGGDVRLQTPEYNVTGAVTRLEQTGSVLQTSETPIRLTTTLAPETAMTVAAGDTVSVANREVATIDAVEAAPTDNQSQRYVTIGATLQTYAGGSSQRYANQSLSLGTSLPFTTTEYTLTGRVTRIGTASIGTATTDLVADTSLPADAATELDVGDTYTVGDTDVATIQSVQFYPGGDNRVQAVLGLSVRTRLVDGTRYFGTTPVTVGASLPFRTLEYEFTGTVSRLNTATLNTTQTNVVFESTLPMTTADALAVGDQFRVRESPVATIDSVQVYPTGDPTEKRVLVGASLQTITRDGTPEFAGTPVKLGTTIPLRTDTYDASGAVVRVEGQTPPGDVTETTVRLKLDNVRPEVANSVQTGMTETTGGTTFATITEKDATDAIVALTSEDGEIFRREHPINQDVSLTVQLRTRTTDLGRTFHGRSLQENTQVVLDLGTTTIQGTVTDIQS
jgi:hypothetical protein